MLTCAFFFFSVFSPICCCGDCCLCGAFSTGNVVFLFSLSLSFHQPYPCSSARFWPANNSVKDINDGTFLIEVTSLGLRETIYYSSQSPAGALHSNCLSRCRQRRCMFQGLFVFCNGVWVRVVLKQQQEYELVTLEWCKLGCRNFQSIIEALYIWRCLSDS